MQMDDKSLRILVRDRFDRLDFIYRLSFRVCRTSNGRVDVIIDNTSLTDAVFFNGSIVGKDIVSLTVLFERREHESERRENERCVQYRITPFRLLRIAVVKVSFCTISTEFGNDASIGVGDALYFVKTVTLAVLERMVHNWRSSTDYNIPSLDLKIQTIGGIDKG